ncbi:MAG: hypothetical protein U0176_00080 [Bacteroidia bacterium]
MKISYLVLIVAILCILSPANASAQAVTIDHILSLPIQRTETPVDSRHLPFYQEALSMGFDDAQIDNPAMRTRLRSKAVYAIDLVYSSFRESPSFSQVELNRRRLVALQAFMPELFENTAILWRIIEQVEDQDKPQAEAFFHGFIFHQRSSSYSGASKGTLTSSAELDIMHSWLGDTLPNNHVPGIRLILEKTCDTTISYIPRFRAVPHPTGKYFPRNRAKRAKGVLYDTRGIWKRHMQTYFTHDTLEPKKVLNIDCEGKRFASGFDPSAYTWDKWTTLSFHDSVIIKTFNAHAHEWKNVIVVEDVTGSMYPYTTQTLTWRRLHATVDPLDRFAFFNDGDARPDGPIGKSNGVYPVKSEDIAEIEKTAQLAMSKGFGGMGPENNIEAMLRAISSSSTQPDRIVMIADNLAPIRDPKLIPELLEKKIPVDIILCGTFWGMVNVDYLNLAAKTGGNFYTMEQELNDLSRMAEGRQLKVGRQLFVFDKGRFRLK